MKASVRLPVEDIPRVEVHNGDIVFVCIFKNPGDQLENNSPDYFFIPQLASAVVIRDTSPDDKEGASLIAQVTPLQATSESITPVSICFEKFPATLIDYQSTNLLYFFPYMLWENGSKITDPSWGTYQSSTPVYIFPYDKNMADEEPFYGIQLYDNSRQTPLVEWPHIQNDDPTKSRNRLHANADALRLDVATVIKAFGFVCTLQLPGYSHPYGEFMNYWWFNSIKDFVNFRIGKGLAISDTALTSAYPFSGYALDKCVQTPGSMCSGLQTFIQANSDSIGKILAISPITTDLRAKKVRDCTVGLCGEIPEICAAQLDGVCSSLDTPEKFHDSPLRKECGCHLPDGYYQTIFQELADLIYPPSKFPDRKAALESATQFFGRGKVCFGNCLDASIPGPKNRPVCPDANICIQNITFDEHGDINGNIDLKNSCAQSYTCQNRCSAPILDGPYHTQSECKDKCGGPTPPPVPGTKYSCADGCKEAKFATGYDTATACTAACTQPMPPDDKTMMWVAIGGGALLLLIIIIGLIVGLRKKS